VGLGPLGGRAVSRPMHQMKDPRRETLPQTLKSRDSRVPKKTLRPYIKCRRPK
ncbi:mCG144791, partial [Mus musculus]